MASVSVEKVQMVRNVTPVSSGNAAYDLSLYANTAASPVKEQQEKRKLRSRAVAAEKPVLQIPLFGVVGIMAAIVLVVSVVFCNMKLNEIIDSSSTLKSRLSTLEEENVRLTGQYSTCLNLTEVEKIATEELGMIASSPENTIYFNLASEDKAVIVEKGSSSIFSSLGQTFSGVAEYFE